MARRKNAMFSIYHLWEEKGVFDGDGEKYPGNPANSGHADYKGPVKYPMMFYHPEGKLRIVRAAEIIQTPVGPKAINEKKALVYALAQSEEEEKLLREAGWHDHPAKAHKAAGRNAAPLGVMDQLKEMQAEIARLQAEKNELQAKVANATTPTDNTKALSTAEALAQSKGPASAAAATAAPVVEDEDEEEAA